MRLTVETPPSRPSERKYILSVLVRDFLGLDWHHVVSDRDDIRISIAGEPGAVKHPDVLFSVPEADWCHERSLPDEPLKRWDPAELGLSGAGSIPVIYGRDPAMAVRDPEVVALPVDVCGSSFFMLSRYEEIARPVADAHDRFPASASLACRAGFVERPLVNDYVDALWEAMVSVWPRLARRERSGTVFVTCDVDEPFDVVSLRPLRLVRSVAGDVARRRQPTLAIRRLANFVASRQGNRRFDPYNTFDWYMTMCEQAGRPAAFYMIPDHSAAVIDGTYDLSDPDIVRLMQVIAGRGHELGVHGSYNSFRDPERIRLERDRLIRACERAGIEAPVTGNRQHYLRWDSAQTPDHLAAAGVEYDTTGSFADRHGFRYGTSWPFPMWGWKTGSALRLMQRPLNVMETSVVDEVYMGLGYTQAAMNAILATKQAALRCGGDFVLLWHNSHFLHPQDPEFFRAAIE